MEYKMICDGGLKSESLWKEQQESSLEEGDDKYDFTSEIHIKPDMSESDACGETDPLSIEDFNQVAEVQLADSPVIGVIEPEFCGVRMESGIEEFYQDETDGTGGPEQQRVKIDLVSNKKDGKQLPPTQRFKKRLNGYSIIKLPKKSYNCSKCGEKFSKKLNFTRHTCIKYLEKTYKCSKDHEATLLEYYDENMVLNKKYLPCLECFKTHCSGKQQEHPKIKLPSFEDKPYKCFTCPESFFKYSELKEHVSRHEDKTLFPCNECDQSFAKKTLLIRHKVIHSSKSRPLNKTGVKHKVGKRSSKAHKDKKN